MFCSFLVLFANFSFPSNKKNGKKQKILNKEHKQKEKNKLKNRHTYPYFLYYPDFLTWHQNSLEALERRTLYKFLLHFTIFISNPKEKIENKYLIRK